MVQLTGTDSLILSEERGNNLVHVGMLGLYDPSSAPGGKLRFKELQRAFKMRLDVSRVFRRRLAIVPLELDRPYWVEAQHIDIGFHVRRIALPRPGNWQQLMTQVERLHARPLDRSRPLWEACVIEGLDDVADLPRGCFAIYLKLHHAAVDGMATIDLIRRLHDPGRPARPQDRSAVPGDEAPNAATTMLRAAVHTVTRARDFARLSLGAATRLAGLGLDALAVRLNPAIHGGERSRPRLALPEVPATRFNRPISASRVVDAVGFPMAAVNRIRRLCDGATVNDVLLAICGGALRQYLLSKHELPEKSLVALMPMSLRDGPPNTDARGNQVGGVPVPLGTDIADPVDRLAAVHRASCEAKQQARLLGADTLMSLVDVIPEAVVDLVLRRVLTAQLNTTVSNVRGPDRPLTFAGARLLRLYPISIPADYVGINHTAVSYRKLLWVSVVSCRRMLPDPAFYAACLRESFAAFGHAADAHGARLTGAVPRPATARDSMARAPRRGAGSRPGLAREGDGVALLAAAGSTGAYRRGRAGATAERRS